MTATVAVLLDVRAERKRQDEKWGDQRLHPDGTGGNGLRMLAEGTRVTTDRAAREGRLTWRDILDGEVAEAFAESDLGKLRAELIQVAAVAVCWVEAIDRRPGE